MTQAGQSVDNRLKRDLDIVAVFGELNVDGDFEDSNGNARFDVFIWVKNTTNAVIEDIGDIDLFVGSTGNSLRIPHEDDVDASVYPRWSGTLEDGKTEWGPQNTLAIVITYDTELAQGQYYAKAVIPQGVADDHFFFMPRATVTVTPTSTPSPTPTPTPIAGVTYYLHNNPSPPTSDTNSQAVLTLDLTAPSATTLYNYDQDRDSDAGLLIVEGGSGADESDATEMQVWRTGALGSDLVIDGDVTFDFWSGMINFTIGVTGSVTIYLRDYDGANYTEIGDATLTQALWQGLSGTWVNKTIDISGLDYTIPAGNELEVKVIVSTSSSNDMWFAYDTTTRDTFITIP